MNEIGVGNAIGRLGSWATSRARIRSSVLRVPSLSTSVSTATSIRRRLVWADIMIRCSRIRNGLEWSRGKRST